MRNEVTLVYDIVDRSFYNVVAFLNWLPPAQFLFSEYALVGFFLQSPINLHLFKSTLFDFLDLEKHFRQLQRCWFINYNNKTFRKRRLKPLIAIREVINPTNGKGICYGIVELGSRSWKFPVPEKSPRKMWIFTGRRNLNYISTSNNSLFLTYFTTKILSINFELKIANSQINAKIH